jgi:hypothetical protein
VTQPDKPKLQPVLLAVPGASGIEKIRHLVNTFWQTFWQVSSLMVKVHTAVPTGKLVVAHANFGPP